MEKIYIYVVQNSCIVIFLIYMFHKLLEDPMGCMDFQNFLHPK